MKNVNTKNLLYNDKFSDQERLTKHRNMLNIKDGEKIDLTTARNIQKRSLSDCLTKTTNENGIISGYASVFNVVDKHGDVVTKGSFKNAVKLFNSGKKPKFLWQHDTTLPIGVIEDIFEDNYGLYIKSRLLLEISKAKEVYALVKNKAIDGFSIGYVIKDSYFNGKTQYITDVDLLEVSVVTFPACTSATIGNVKSNENVLQCIKALSEKIKNITKGE